MAASLFLSCLAGTFACRTSVLELGRCFSRTAGQTESSILPQDMLRDYLGHASILPQDMLELLRTHQYKLSQDMSVY